MRHAPFAFVLVALSLLVMLPAAAFSSTIIYPGPAPCNSTLQACINAANAGDVVQTATVYIDESIVINKSLTLMPAPGFGGTFLGGGATARFISIADGPNGETLKITLDKIVIDPGAISISLDQGSGHSIVLRNSGITSTLGSTATRGIYTDIRASAFITVEKTLIQGHGYGINFFSLTDASEAVHFKAVGNRITGNNSSLSTTGIDVDLRGAGYATATLQSNVIWGVAHCNCGASSGIFVSTSDTGSSLVHIINNTLDQVGSYGILNYPTSGTGNRQTYIFNNIVTNAQTGFYAPVFAQNLGIYHNYNNFYGNVGGNQYNGYPPGAQTYNFNPLNSEQGYGHYALQPNSPAINAGTTGSGVTLSTFDALPNPRLIGNTVDLGAYESTYANGSEYMLLADHMGGLSSQYSYPKGTWITDGSNAIGFSNKKATFLASPAFVACSQCQFETTFKTSANVGSGPASRVWIQAWYQDKSNLVEVIVKEGADKLTFRQKVGGGIVTKSTVNAVIEPFTEYRLKLVFDGVNILVFLDGNQVFAVPASGTPSGTFGFQAKASYGYIADFFIHY